MIQKYILSMTCEEAGQVHGLGGAELHGMLFSFLKEIDPEKTDTLHGAVEKPFSLGPLQGAETCGNKLRYIQGQTCSFTLSCLNDAMCEFGENIAAKWRDKTVRLGTGMFRGSQVSSVLPPDFCYGKLLNLPPLEGEFTLEFYSPTSFRSHGRQILFPLPEKVFLNLQRRWNHFSPVKYQDDTDFSFIVPSRYNLRTVMIYFEHYKIIGFTGRCSYLIPGKYKEIMGSRLGALVCFAQIAGVGYKTSMAMGQVKILQK